MDASKVRQALARVLESVRDRREKVIIVRYGQPIAALVPIEHLSPKERKEQRKIQARRPAGDASDGLPKT